MPTLLVRYGEIGLKSESVRRRFEQQLVADIRTRHALAKVPCVISQARGRIFVDSDDWRKSSEILSRTFGIVSFSPVTVVGSDLDELTKAALEFSEPLMCEGATFAIRARRSGSHKYTSQTLAEHLGRAVLDRYSSLNVKVRLEEPEIELSVEVRDNKAYLFSSTLAGPGGMPLGTQGRILSVVESERGLAATWLMMKRGCSVLVAAQDQAMLAPLNVWNPHLRTAERSASPFIQAEENECTGIAFEWSLHEIETEGAPKGDLPVFYPLVGMNEDEIRSLLARVLS
ncbi:MAG: THUMP domain-containing protein [Thermoplasmata archaeon]|nr:THUMP domain-containing protein [Thermoplasmata archaeon]